jgi:predicted acyl esterase
MRCSDDNECFLTPGEPVEIEVDLWSTAMVFNRGHRLRISVSGSNWPRFEVNPNHGGDLDGNEPGVPARPQILVGPDYPSRLVLPVPITEPRRGGRRVSTPIP